MGASRAFVVRSVTVIMGVVVGLAFLFGFGNVLSLAMHLGVPLEQRCEECSVLGLQLWALVAELSLQVGELVA